MITQVEIVSFGAVLVLVLVVFYFLRKLGKWNISIDEMYEYPMSPESMELSNGKKIKKGSTFTYIDEDDTTCWMVKNFIADFEGNIRYAVLRKTDENILKMVTVDELSCYTLCESDVTTIE